MSTPSDVQSSLRSRRAKRSCRASASRPARKRRHAKVSPGSSGCARPSCRRSCRSGPIGRPIFRCASKARSPRWRGASSTRAARVAKAAQSRSPAPTDRRCRCRGSRRGITVLPSTPAAQAPRRRSSRRRQDAGSRATSPAARAAGASRPSSTPFARARTSASAPMRMPARRPRTPARSAPPISASARSTPFSAPTAARSRPIRRPRACSSRRCTSTRPRSRASRRSPAQRLPRREAHAHRRAARG